MQNLHYGLIMLLMLMSPVTTAKASVSIGIGLPNVSIGINLPVFPELVRVPGYPVYYAPQMASNYFFYDGMYWVYQDDNWYASSWYNGPWSYVGAEFVPLFILRVPVRYYRQPPVYFRGWQSNAPPRWGQHWGHGWEQQHRGWDRWSRRSAPAPAPLPVYQRQYSGDRYPRVEQQHSLRNQSYRYQPRDKAVREHFKQVEQKRAPAPAQRERQETPGVRSPGQVEHRQQREQQQRQQNDQRQERQQREQLQQRPQTDQRQERQQREQLQQRQQTDQRQQREQREQLQQKQQTDQRQQQQKQQVEQRQQQQQKQQVEQRQPREQQAPRVQEHEQRSQERGASQEPGRDRDQGQGRDEGRGRGRDK